MQLVGSTVGRLVHLGQRRVGHITLWEPAQTWSGVVACSCRDLPTSTSRYAAKAGLPSS